MMKESPSLFGGDQRRREDDCMERHIIFSHELVKPNILILPPFFVVFLKEVGSY